MDCGIRLLASVPLVFQTSFLCYKKVIIPNIRWSQCRLHDYFVHPPLYRLVPLGLPQLNFCVGVWLLGMLGNTSTNHIDLSNHNCTVEVKPVYNYGHNKKNMTSVNASNHNGNSCAVSIV